MFFKCQKELFPQRFRIPSFLEKKLRKKKHQASNLRNAKLLSLPLIPANGSLHLLAWDSSQIAEIIHKSFGDLMPFICLQSIQATLSAWTDSTLASAVSSKADTCIIYVMVQSDGEELMWNSISCLGGKGFPDFSEPVSWLVTQNRLLGVEVSLELVVGILLKAGGYMGPKY